MKKVVITIPTYNERENVPILITSLFNLEASKKTKYKISVLVIDDRSPDGTADEIRRMQKIFPDLYLIQGRKNGLGAAYRRGFNYVLKNIKFDVVVMMDADMSHDPNDVPHLLEAIDQGNDIAIGSRYAPGGMIPGSWPLLRILNTRVAHFVARFVGGIDTELAELTGGFKAMRRTALERIPYRKARVSGFGFQLFLSNEFVNQEFLVTEVPINFHDRLSGSSKMRSKDIIEFIRIAAELNETSSFKTLMRQCIAAITGVLVTIASYFVIKDLFVLDVETSAIFAAQLGLLTTLFILLIQIRTLHQDTVRLKVKTILIERKGVLAVLAQPLVASAILFSFIGWYAWALVVALLALSWYIINSESTRDKVLD